MFREGTGWMESILERLEVGDADLREIPMLEEISRGTERRITPFVPFHPLDPF